MLPAFEAILGHRSAHSLATGPVIAEPVKITQNFSTLHNAVIKNTRHTAIVHIHKNLNKRHFKMYSVNQFTGHSRIQANILEGSQDVLMASPQADPPFK